MPDLRQAMKEMVPTIADGDGIRATNAEVDAGTEPNKWVSPAGVRRALTQFGPTQFATAAQGALADTAVQPGSLAAVAFSGQFGDLSGTPQIVSTIVAGTGISVDDTDPANPVVSAAGGGSGDMTKAVYDPQTIEADAFDRANHTGSQAASTISDFSTAADARVSAAIGVSVQAFSAALASWAGVTRASGFDTFAAAPSSANLRALLTDEVGTGAAYFVGGALGTPASGTLTNATGLPIVAGTTGTLTPTRGGTNQTTYATGDLIYASAANTLAKRGIGSNDDVLTVMGGVPVWAAPTGGLALTLTHIANVATTTGSTQSLTSIPTTYKGLLLVLNQVSHNSGSTQSFRVAFSSNNGSSYGTARDITDAPAAAGNRSGDVQIFNTGASGANKIGLVHIVNGTSGIPAYGTPFTETSITGLINALQFSPSGGSFDAGSIDVYGIS